MLLSQLRWLMALAIGVAVMIAMYLDPEVKAPDGTLAPKRPSETRSVATPSTGAQSDESRRAAFEQARTALLQYTPEGPVREAALASLRRQYLPPDEWKAPSPAKSEPSPPKLPAPATNGD
jgi:hypothetical protein